MSFWVYLENEKGEPVEVTHHENEGGTVVMGGTNEAELNVTYNYARHYFSTLDSEQGLRWLDGKTGGYVLPRLVKAFQKLGVNPDSDYWKSTPGNAGRVLALLAQWAKEHPEARFRVS